MVFVYLIRNSSGKLYTGITDNPLERLRYHNSKRGAKFTKYIPDFQVVFLERYENLVLARKREVQIKKWSRSKKEVLIYKYAIGEETKL